eukprot:TRINITY_DN109000_c0_g1_i1.p1 TRINITY_DN109000_c0_g1~~TRINITY_DN109000_c0_g1_i1.p1  ORF type:complete len:968 (+),score=183.23 TRINITY_DN109000_c0_g1_i1:101-2905(+)
MSELEFPCTPTKALLRKKRLRMPLARRGSGIDMTGAMSEVVRLASHKVPKDKDETMRDMATQAIKENRFCKTLQESALQELFGLMDYFEFEVGEVIVNEGELGAHFFVLHAGSVRIVREDGNVLALRKAPDTFGSVSMMYKSTSRASVIAVEKTGVWAAPRKAFKSVLKRELKAQQEENKGFLDRVSLFDSLSAQQKQAITSTALVIERFSPGQVVAVQGCELISLFVVKSGRLRRVKGGKFAEDGSIIDGLTVTELGTGQCFGERAFWTGVLNHSLVADTECELIGLPIVRLQECLGDDLARTFQRLFVGSVLHHFPVAERMVSSERARLINAMDRQILQVGDKVCNDVKLLLVLEGKLCFGDVVLQRGDWCLDQSLSTQLQQTFSMQNFKPCEPSSLTPFEVECCVATATESTLLGCWEGQMDWGGDVSSQMIKMALLKQSHIFQHIPSSQISRLAKSLLQSSFKAGEVLFEAGDTGSDLYIVLTGEVDSSSAVLGPGSCFEERALLFNELKQTSAKACKDTELCTLSREAFREVVSASVREDIAVREELRNKSVDIKDFKAIRLIGVGSFGAVRLVEHAWTGTRFALKRIRKEHGEVPLVTKRESDLALQANHPFLLSTYAAFETPRSLYILSELISGGQLYEEIQKQKRVCSKKQAQFYIGCLILAIESLHQKSIVYRDIKPENVMISSEGYPKLVDFGLTKKLEPTNPRTYTVAGTVYYMAPDIIRGEGYSTEVDLWALGVLLFELVCGCMPFGEEGTEDREIIKSIMDDPLIFPGVYNDVSGKRLLQGLLERQPGKRLGAQGFEDIKECKFFKNAGKDYFSRLLAREVEPPVRPSNEWPDEAKLIAESSLSDGEEFYPDKDSLLTALEAIDEKPGCGTTLTEDAMAGILTTLTGKTHARATVQKLAWSADRKGTGTVSYGEFLRFLHA